MSATRLALTIDEYAAQIDQDVATVEKAIEVGMLPFIRLGRDVVRVRADQPWPEIPDKHWPDLPFDLIDRLRAFVEQYGVDHARAHLLRKPANRKPIKQTVRAAVVKRDGRTCQYCHKTIGPRSKFHLDHVVPYSQGGPSEADNLAVACVSCNSAKGANAGYRCRSCDCLVWSDGWNHHNPTSCANESEAS